MMEFYIVIHYIIRGLRTVFQPESWSLGIAYFSSAILILTLILERRKKDKSYNSNSWMLDDKRKLHKRVWFFRKLIPAVTSAVFLLYYLIDRVPKGDMVARRTLFIEIVVLLVVGFIIFGKREGRQRTNNNSSDSDTYNQYHN